jgi:hypothetical protein
MSIGRVLEDTRPPGHTEETAMHPTVSYCLAQARPVRGAQASNVSRLLAARMDVIMCTHDPACPAADAIDWWAARRQVTRCDRRST